MTNFFFLVFKKGFFCIAMAIMDLTLTHFIEQACLEYIKICLRQPPKYWG